jgi:hypothetical protein
VRLASRGNRGRARGGGEYLLEIIVRDLRHPLGIPDRGAGSGGIAEGDGQGHVPVVQGVAGHDAPAVGGVITLGPEAVVEGIEGKGPASYLLDGRGPAGGEVSVGVPVGRWYLLMEDSGGQSIDRGLVDLNLGEPGHNERS